MAADKTGTRVLGSAQMAEEALAQAITASCCKTGQNGNPKLIAKPYNSEQTNSHTFSIKAN
jgi:hypothetical protein